MSTHGRRIIVVEDHEDSRELMLAVAQMFAADCSGAATVEEARAAFLARRPDVLITDYQLPDGNGLDLLRWIRTDQHGHDLFVVLVSAHRDQKRLREAAAVCGALFLPKPVDIRALHDAIEGALARRGRD